VAHVAAWVPQFKELIPLLVRPKVVAFVQRASMGAQAGPKEAVDVAAHLFGRDARRNTIGALTGDDAFSDAAAAPKGSPEAQALLHSEAMRLNEQSGQEQAQLQADPLVMARRAALVTALVPSLEFATHAVMPLVAAAEQPNGGHSMQQ